MSKGRVMKGNRNQEGDAQNVNTDAGRVENGIACNYLGVNIKVGVNRREKESHRSEELIRVGNAV